MNDALMSGNFYGCDVRASGLGPDYIAKYLANGGPLCGKEGKCKLPSNLNGLIGDTAEIKAAAKVRRKRRAGALTMATK